METAKEDQLGTEWLPRGAPKGTVAAAPGRSSGGSAEKLEPGLALHGLDRREALLEQGELGG